MSTWDFKPVKDYKKVIKIVKAKKSTKQKGIIVDLVNAKNEKLATALITREEE